MGNCDPSNAQSPCQLIIMVIILVGTYAPEECEPLIEPGPLR